MVVITSGAPSAANAGSTASSRPGHDCPVMMTVVDAIVVEAVVVDTMMPVMMHGTGPSTMADSGASVTNHSIHLNHQTRGRFRQVGPHISRRGCLSAND